MSQSLAQETAPEEAETWSGALRDKGALSCGELGRHSLADKTCQGPAATKSLADTGDKRKAFALRVQVQGEANSGRGAAFSEPWRPGKDLEDHSK